MEFSSKPKENPWNLLSFQFWTHVKNFIHYLNPRLICLYGWNFIFTFLKKSKNKEKLIKKTLILCVSHNGIFKQTKRKSLKPFIIPILDPCQTFHPLFKSSINLYIWMKFHLHLLEKVKKLRKTNQEVLNVIDIGLWTWRWFLMDEKWNIHKGHQSALYPLKLTNNRIKREKPWMSLIIDYGLGGGS